MNRVEVCHHTIVIATGVYFLNAFLTTIEIIISMVADISTVVATRDIMHCKYNVYGFSYM